jgi:nucleoside-diphosphate-sugar epimerase
VEGIFRLFFSDYPDPVNIGNPSEFTIGQLAEIVLAETGSRSAIRRHPLPEDDPQVRQPDITLARKLLDWNPSTELRQGLTETIPYFRSLVEEEGATARILGES